MDNKTIAGISVLLLVLGGGITYEVFTKDEIILSNTNYSKVCEPIKQLEITTYNCKEMAMIPIYADVYYAGNKSYSREVIGFEEKEISQICSNRTYNIVGCKNTGEILINSTLYKKDYYFCGLDDKSIVCDNNQDTHGGQGDGNGDGICQKGETCIVN